MANTSSLLTTYAIIHELEKFYYSPISYVGEGKNLMSNLYCFLSYDNTVQDPNDPIEESVRKMKNIFDNMFAIKRLRNNEISPAIENIRWEKDIPYDIYKDSDDIFQKNALGKLIKHFYIINKYDQVFKCLWNAKDISQSSNIILIERFQDNTINVYFETAIEYNIGDYITLDNVSPKSYNGIYKVVYSASNVVTLEASKTKLYSIYTDEQYVSGGIIYSSPLSQYEPFLDIGTFDNSLLITTADGYKWKYIFTLDKGQKERFFNSDYVPILIGTESPPNSFISTYGSGSIDCVGVANSGSLYIDGIDTTEIRIVGDGTGANAVAYVVSNTIQDIIITDFGKNYTYANVEIVPVLGDGTGAIAEVYPSPIGGHGFDPITEFGCDTLIVTAQFEGSEGGKIPTDIIFNQIGLLVNPYSKDNQEFHANGTIYTTYTSLLISPSVTQFERGEIVIQGVDVNNYTYKAECLSYDNINNVLYVINTDGTPSLNYAIYGTSSGAYSILSGTNPPTLSPYTGYITYIQNLYPTQRNALDTEKFNLILKY